jgi:hypothetical protein
MFMINLSRHNTYVIVHYTFQMSYTIVSSYMYMVKVTLVIENAPLLNVSFNKLTTSLYNSLDSVIPPGMVHVSLSGYRIGLTRHGNSLTRH